MPGLLRYARNDGEGDAARNGWRAGLGIILSSAWFCALLFIAVSLPVIATSLPVIARNEAIQAQATTWIASFVAGDGRNTMHKNIPREV
ncbi:MAG: hypothetical protein LBJ47_02390 [Tannerella sp.]|nr:hypothetical protein [Tannerella sp.]